MHRIWPGPAYPHTRRAGPGPIFAVIAAGLLGRGATHAAVACTRCESRQLTGLGVGVGVGGGGGPPLVVLPPPQPTQNANAPTITRERSVPTVNRLVILPRSVLRTPRPRMYKC